VEAHLPRCVRRLRLDVDSTDLPLVAQQPPEAHENAGSSAHRRAPGPHGDGRDRTRVAAPGRGHAGPCLLGGSLRGSEGPLSRTTALTAPGPHRRGTDF
jgi:hypothetical protein